MKETKRRFEYFMPYDCSGMQTHLERMAQKGWLLEEIGTYLWQYRRIEPKKLHFTVTYLPNISEFDPENTEGLLEMEEYCTKYGWKLAARNGKMQVFYHEGENPAPIETDAVTQLQTIHRAMCKNWLWGQGLNVVISISQLVLSYIQFLQSPIEFLSTPIRLYIPFLWLMLLISSLYMVGSYALWYRKAKREVQYGIFPATKRNTNIKFSLVSIGIAGAVLLMAGTKIALVSLLGMFGVVGIITTGMNVMKKRGVSRSINQTVSIGLCLCLTFVMIGGIGWYTMKSERKPVGYYDRNGWRMKVFDEALPLYVQDLLQTAQKDWSTEVRKSETFFVKNTEYNQRPLTEKHDIPELEYTVTDIKSPALYAFCKSALIGQYQDKIRHGEIIYRDAYEAVDASPWHAEEVYQRYWRDGYLNKYLLCYANRFVEISFDWNPTAEQMEIVAEKLGK